MQSCCETRLHCFLFNTGFASLRSPNGSLRLMLARAQSALAALLGVPPCSGAGAPSHSVTPRRLGRQAEGTRDRVPSACRPRLLGVRTCSALISASHVLTPRCRCGHGGRSSALTMPGRPTFPLMSWKSYLASRCGGAQVALIMRHHCATCSGVGSHLGGGWCKHTPTPEVATNPLSVSYRVRGRKAEAPSRGRYCLPPPIGFPRQCLYLPPWGAAR